MQNDNQTTEHGRLCHIAAKWLHSKGCVFAVAELTATCGEIPDAVGFKAWTTYMVEVKVSRSDFLRDKKKRVRQIPEKGIGDFRYYLCPTGLIQPEEVPERWGLLYSDGKIIKEIKPPLRQDSSHFSALNIAVSTMRRVFDGCPNIEAKLYCKRRRTA
jgi:hypothetical protein